MKIHAFSIIFLITCTLNNCMEYFGAGKNDRKSILTVPTKASKSFFIPLSYVYFDLKNSSQLLASMINHPTQEKKSVTLSEDNTSVIKRTVYYNELIKKGKHSAR